MEEDIVAEISLKDETFSNQSPVTSNQLPVTSNQQSASGYQQLALSIQISLKELTYCIFDTSRNKFVALESYRLHDVYNAFQLAERLSAISYLLSATGKIKLNTENWKRKTVIYINQKSTLVPLPLFDVNDQETYFNFNHTLDDSEDLYCDRLNNLNAYNLYAVPTMIKNKLREVFGEHKLYHYMTTLVESLLIYNKNKSEEKQVFLNSGKGTFDIIVIEGNNLIYNNTFEFQTAEDLIYYLLFALQQLKLNPETIDLTLMGEIEKNTPLFEVIYKYVRNVSFIKRNERFQYSYLFEKIPQHGYFNLFNSMLME